MLVGWGRRQLLAAKVKSNDELAEVAAMNVEMEEGGM